MKTSAISIFLFILMSFNVVKAQDAVKMPCEPSLLFPEIFFIESNRCFSNLEAQIVYSDKEQLVAYLNLTENSGYQTVYRYLYYLREKEYLPALMVFMFMVNTGSVPDSMDINNEFSNILAGGLKKQKSETQGSVFFSGGSSQQVSVDKLSTDFFSVLSFIASYSKQDGPGRKESDSVLMIRTFYYMISNIQSGIDWGGDQYLNSLFNKFVYMKNNSILEGFTRFFFFYLGGDNKVPSFMDYLKLRETGMIKDMKISKNSENVMTGRAMVSFYFEHFDKVPAIDFLPVDRTPEEKDEFCKYLDERDRWIKNLSEKDAAEIDFNESVKIVEQCPGAFSMPFVISESRIIIYDSSLWSADLAIALSYVLKNHIAQNDADALLRSATVSSLIKSLESGQRTLAMDFLSYAHETGNLEKALKSLFVKQMPENDKNNNAEPITQAAEIISEILF